MSAYGAITTSNRPTEPLASTLWHCKPRGADSPKYLTIHPLTLATAKTNPGLVEYLHSCFAEEVERGRTYPQAILQGEAYTQGMFEGYFFAADALVAVIGQGDILEGIADGGVIEKSVAEASGERTWEQSIAGVYYVKPNYPGRSSHVSSLSIDQSLWC